MPRLRSTARLVLAALALFAAVRLDAASAATLTPPNLVQATTILDADLALVWDTADGGPLKAVQWSVMKSLMVTAIGSNYLIRANNLSDLPSPSTARGSLGLGSAALLNTGTAGGVLCQLNAACVVSAVWTFGDGDLVLSGSGSGAATVKAPATGGGTVTLFAGSDTVVGKATTDTLTNKSLTSPAITGSPTINGLAPVTTDDIRFQTAVQNSQSAAYGILAADCGKTIYHPSADTTPRTVTLPANGTLALPVGCKIDYINDCSAGAWTLAITTDTLVWFPTGTTGSRTLGACGEATATKVGTTRWVLVGTGLSVFGEPANDNAPTTLEALVG